MHKSTLFFIAVLVLPGGAAQAANWTGAYVGAHVGVVGGTGNVNNIHNNNSTNPLQSGAELFEKFGTPNSTFSSPFDNGGSYIISDCYNSTGPDHLCGDIGPWLDATGGLAGYIAGLQAGYNWQMGKVVVGLNASLSGSNGTSDAEQNVTDGRDAYYQNIMGYQNVYFDGPPPAGLAVSIGSLQRYTARAGYLLTDDLLLYADAGLAVAQISAVSTATSGPYGVKKGVPVVSGAGYARGLTVGAGAEFSINDKVSIYGQYSYADVGGVDVYEGKGTELDAGVKEHTIEIGLNFHPQ